LWEERSMVPEKLWEVGVHGTRKVVKHWAEWFKAYETSVLLWRSCGISNVEGILCNSKKEERTWVEKCGVMLIKRRWMDVTL
jgi:hypothetical protein